MEKSVWSDGSDPLTGPRRHLPRTLRIPLPLRGKEQKKKKRKLKKTFHHLGFTIYCYVFSSSPSPSELCSYLLLRCLQLAFRRRSGISLVPIPARRGTEREPSKSPGLLVRLASCVPELRSPIALLVWLLHLLQIDFLTRSC
jgi:hypothetical protein